MKKQHYLLIIIACFLHLFAFSQMNVKDSSIATPIIGVSYGYYFPSGNLKNRFGDNSSIQFNVDYKTIKYWTFGVNGSYIFGKDVKESLFDSISGPDGTMISQDGAFANIRLFERGLTLSATFGRMFAFKKPNPNSGICLNIGLGFLQHKIRIETVGNNVPQLSKEYKKGYDRLTNGFLLSENIGYLYLSNNRLINFYIGFECMQGFTQNRRSYDFDKMQRDNTKRIDIFYGGKIAWLLPLYKKPPQDYYTY